MEVNTDPVFDRAGEAAPQLDVSSSATHGSVARTMWNNRSFETSSRNTRDAKQCRSSHIGGLRSFDGHQEAQTNVMSAIEITKEDSAAETIDEDSCRYDYFSGELLDRTKFITGRKE